MAKYNVQARSGEAINIQVEVPNLHIHQAVAFYEVLNKAFRAVDVIDNETGEVVLSKYFSSDLFYPITTIDEALADIEQLRREFLEH